jgi:hypothetical protein
MRKVRVSKPDGTGVDKEAEWVVVNEAGCLIGGHTKTTDDNMPGATVTPGTPHIDWAYAPGAWKSFRDSDRREPST